MQKTEKFFIFSWKELVVIGLLVATTVGFFFTLGLHYGKKLHGDPAPSAEVEAKKLEESPEVVPPKDTLEEGAQHGESVAQEAIKATTEAAIKESNLKIEHPRPVDLPKEKAVEHAAEAPPAEEVSAEEAPAPVVHEASRFSIQLGSYPSKKEAQHKIAALQKRGLKPEIMVAQVKGETRYRVVINGFKTKASADSRGHELKVKRKVENFIVIKSE